MRPLLLALALAFAPALPALAEHHAAKAPKGEHQDAATSFEKQPAAGTWAKCPVSGDIFQVDKETQFATYQGRTYAFCCEDCKPDFDKDPARFADKNPATKK